MGEITHKNRRLQRLWSSPIFKWWLRVVIAAVLVVSLASHVGWQAIGRALSDVNLSLALLSWLLCLLARVVDAIQLSMVITRAGSPTHPGHTLAASSLSTLYGLVLPGDLVAGVAKWGYLSKVTQRRSLMFNAIVYNRLLTLAPMLAICLVATFLYNPWDSSYLPLTSLLGFLIVTAFTTVMYSAAWGLDFGRLVSTRSVKRRPSGISSRIHYLMGSAIPFQQFPRMFHFGVVILASISIGLFIASFVAMAYAVGISISLGVLTWVWVALLLARQFPISFQGIGIRETTLVILLGVFGVAEERAFGLGLLGFTHVVLFACFGLIVHTFVLLKADAVPMRSGDAKT